MSVELLNEMIFWQRLARIFPESSKQTIEAENTLKQAGNDKEELYD